jgi:chemotaxis protein MotB
MARKKKHEEHENHERWLVSYADFITLLFAFFTSMYALSSVNEGKFRVLSQSLASAFTPSLFITQRPAEAQKLVRDMKSLSADEFKNVFAKGSIRIQNVLRNLSNAEKLTFIIDEQRITIRITEGILFEPSTDVLVNDALPVLDEIAAALKDMNLTNNIRIEGHTDNIPVSTPKFPSNWDLSSARALRILKYMIETHRYDPKNMVAVGYGEYKPIASNDTPQGREKNRRVDITVVNSDLVELR